jgi:hypothetical protein
MKFKQHLAEKWTTAGVGGDESNAAHTVLVRNELECQAIAAAGDAARDGKSSGPESPRRGCIDCPGRGETYDSNRTYPVSGPS